MFALILLLLTDCLMANVCPVSMNHWWECTSFTPFATKPWEHKTKNKWYQWGCFQLQNWKQLQASLVLFHFAVLHFTGVAFSYKLKAKRLQLGLLQWFRTEPTISPRYACTQTGLTVKSRGFKYGLIISPGSIFPCFSQLCPPLCISSAKLQQF